MVALSLALGITLGYYFPLSVPVFIFLLLLLPAILLVPREFRGRVLFVFLMILAGFCWLSWQEAKYQSDLSIARWNDRGPYPVTGEVVEDLSSITGNNIYLKPLLIDQSRVKYGLIQLDKRYLPVALKNGDLIRLRLFLKKPSVQLNPGGFSNYKYLKKKGIFSQGYLVGEIEKLGQINHLFKDSVINLKKRLLKLLDATIVRPYNEILKALILGERDHLPEEWESGFTRAGANHLLAISGLHVGFILLIFLAFFNSLNLSPGLRNFSISLLLILYMVLTGLRASILRAGILSLSFLWAPYFKREGDLLNLLGLTSIINLLINPYDLFTVGFQLTYLVLLMIVLWGRILSNYLHPLLAVSIAAQLASIPLTAYYFNLITPVGILTNIWAIPLVGLIVSGAMVGLVLGLINPIFSWLLNKFIYYLLVVLRLGIRFMVRIPLGYLEVPSPYPVTVFIIIGFLIFLPFILKKRIVPLNISKRERRLNLMVIIALLIILVHLIIPLFQKDLEIIFFAVGQGDAILIHLPPDKYIIVDGGGMAGQDSNKGEQVVLPYLKKQGIKKLDLIFVTHFDTDHVLGITSLVEKRMVDLVVFPANFQRNQLAEEIIKTAGRKDIPIRMAAEGDTFKIGELFLQVLNPPRNLPYQLSRNDNSLVLKLVYRRFTLLLTGDLEKEGEYRLLRANYNLRSQILKFGHHGSGSSSTYSFLKKVLPEEGIVSVGRNNFGHPSPSVLQRASSLGIRIWRTDRQGAIMIKTDGYSYRIKGFKD